MRFADQILLLPQFLPCKLGTLPRLQYHSKVSANSVEVRHEGDSALKDFSFRNLYV
jgi:hypothetical protein